MVIMKGSLLWRVRWLAKTIFWPVFLIVVVALPIWNFVLAYFQGEATSSLTAIIKEQKEYKQASGGWAGSFDDFNLVLDEKGRYTYFLSPTEYSGRPPEELGLEVPLDFEALGAPDPGQDRDSLTVVAVGNIDFDPDLDVWWIDDNLEIQNTKDDISGTWGMIKEFFQGIYKRISPPKPEGEGGTE